MFCSQIFTLKLNLRLKVGLTYAISVVNFLEFLSKKIFFYFPLLNLNYWCFTTILWKFQKNWTSETSWKSGSKLPTLHISAWFGFVFTMGKTENILFFKNQWLEWNFSYIGSYGKWFCINHDKILQTYFFCVKRQAKNDFLKDVESTVMKWRYPHLSGLKSSTVSLVEYLPALYDVCLFVIKDSKFLCNKCIFCWSHHLSEVSNI